MESVVTGHWTTDYIWEVSIVCTNSLLKDLLFSLTLLCPGGFGMVSAALGLFFGGVASLDGAWGFFC